LANLKFHKIVKTMLHRTSLRGFRFCRIYRRWLHCSGYSGPEKQLEGMARSWSHWQVLHSWWEEGEQPVASYETLSLSDRGEVRTCSRLHAYGYCVYMQPDPLPMEDKVELSLTRAGLSW